MENKELERARVEALHRKYVIKTDTHYNKATAREWLAVCEHAMNFNGDIVLPLSVEKTIDIPLCLRVESSHWKLVDVSAMSIADFRNEYMALHAILPRKSLQDRFWAFSSAEYEAGLGMTDLIATFGSYGEAHDFLMADQSLEWGCIFDSKTGQQADISDVRSGEPARISNPLR